MKIGIFGSQGAKVDLESIEGFKGQVAEYLDPETLIKDLPLLDLLLIFDPLPYSGLNLDSLSKFQGIIGLNSIHGSALSQMLEWGRLPFPTFSFVGLNGFLNRQEWELGLPFEEEKEKIFEAFQKAGISANPVKDRVGLASARVVGMIINEAFFTVMEGTSEKEDIDTAMKLGTNYPFGPFEMVEKAGIQNILALMENLYEENKDDRYKPCPLLREEALKASMP